MEKFYPKQTYVGRCTKYLLLVAGLFLYSFSNGQTWPATISIKDGMYASVNPLIGTGKAKLFFLGTLNGHAYYASNDYYYWQESQDIAEALCGHLVTLTSKAENDFITKQVEDKMLVNWPSEANNGPTNTPWYWIGLRRQTTSNPFQWVTGEPYNYSNWAIGEPNNYLNGGEVAVHFYFNEPGVINGQWNDRPDWDKPFIMEIDHPSVGMSDLSVDPNLLWPPNHKLQDVTINYTNGCNGIGDNACQIKSITSDEPLNSTGDGNTSFDWEIVNNHQVKLRSERKGNGDGRIYTITVECLDALTGKPVTKSIKVGVPHDQSESSVGAVLNIIASPNPTTSQFLLNIASTDKKTKVKVRITDFIMGKVIEEKKNLNPNQTLQLGSLYKKGIYVAEITQGAHTVTLKLVKN